MNSSSLKVLVRRNLRVLAGSWDVREGSREHVSPGNVRLGVQGCRATHTHDLIETIEAPVVLELGRIRDPSVLGRRASTALLSSETHEGGGSIERHELNRLLDPHEGVIVVLPTVRFPDRRRACVGSRSLPMSDASASSIFRHLLNYTYKLNLTRKN